MSEEAQQKEHSGTYAKRTTIVTTSVIGGGSTLASLAMLGPGWMFGAGLATAALLYLENHGTAEEYAWAMKYLSPVARKVSHRMRKPVPHDEMAPPFHPSQPDDQMKPTPSVYDFQAEDELSAPRQKPQGVMLFSDTLKTFTPSLDKIYLGTLESGEMLFCKAEDLCHVALAGATRGGKSSIMRMLLAQLCKAGASVLLLNPHYSRYILDKKEDWTPFEPYLMYDPMECRKYGVIEFYLRQVATELLPKRLDKYAHSLPVGKPYFLALDELPAIIKHVPNASDYLESILREGAKVGIFLITAAQDFLVKTISPTGSGGAVRECYRSAYYVGGDATTAKVLLDMPASQIAEEHLGKGAIMLRNWVVAKKAGIAYVPLVDNQALYTLLGPSTYVPAANQGDEIALEELRPVRAPEPHTDRVPVVVARYPVGATRERRMARNERLRNAGRVQQDHTSEKTELDRALEAYDAGSTTVDALAVALGKTQWKVRPLYAQVKMLRQ